MKPIMLVIMLVGTGPHIRAALCSTLQGATLNRMPQCAATCLNSSSPERICNIPDPSSLEQCIHGSCTVKESLAARRFLDETCERKHRNSSGPKLLIVSWIFMSLALAATFMRLLSRRKLSTALNFGDYLAFTASIMSIGLVISATVAVLHFGLGQDVWFLEPHQITKFLIVLFSLTYLYAACMSMIKIAILSLYARIFPGSRVRALIHITQVLCALAGVALFLINTLQCSPVSYFWTGWTGEVEGSCINILDAAYATTAINILFDVWIMLLPCPDILKLQLSWRKKVQIIAMFSLGIFVAVASALRLTSVKKFSDMQNPSRNCVDLVMYSILEITVGIVCVCLPDVRVLLARHMQLLQSSAILSVSGHTQGTVHATNVIGEGQENNNSAAVKRARDLDAGDSSSAVELVDTGMQISSRQSSWELGFHGN